MAIIRILRCHFLRILAVLADLFFSRLERTRDDSAPPSWVRHEFPFSAEKSEENMKQHNEYMMSALLWDCFLVSSRWCFHFCSQFRVSDVHQFKFSLQKHRKNIEKKHQPTSSPTFPTFSLRQMPTRVGMRRRSLPHRFGPRSSARHGSLVDSGAFCFGVSGC